MMSVSDWPEIWAEAFEVPEGPGSKSLSSSSSPRLGSRMGGDDKMLVFWREHWALSLLSGTPAPKQLQQTAAVCPCGPWGTTHLL